MTRSLDASGYDRLPHDGYHTIDPLAVETLARNFRLWNRRILEPCAGRGDLVRQLKAHGGLAIASELHGYPDQDPSIETGCDFLKTSAAPAVDMIATNPPYDQASAFVAHALDLMPRGYVVMLLRHDWICRRSEVFANRLRSYIPIRGRLKWIEGPSRNTARHNFAWAVWGVRDPRRQPSLLL